MGKIFVSTKKKKDSCYLRGIRHVLEEKVGRELLNCPPVTLATVLFLFLFSVKTRYRKGSACG